MNLVPFFFFFFFFAQVSWAWQWLCRLSLVELFNGNLFYAVLSLQGGGEWWWGETLFEHLQMILGMAALFFSLPLVSSGFLLEGVFFFFCCASFVRLDSQRPEARLSRCPPGQANKAPFLPAQRKGFAASCVALSMGTGEPEPAVSRSGCLEMRAMKPGGPQPGEVPA